jgi:hypothetical protein
MARGWESKSVEDQVQEAQSRQEHATKQKLTAEQAEHLRRREVLILTITRVRKQLESASEPRYREQLLGALASLEAQLAEHTS